MLGEPAHDRRRRQSAGGDVGQSGGSLRQQAGDAGEPLHGLMLEHRARGDDEPHLARPAHQLDRHDAVAAEREEVVVDADLLKPQHLGKQRAQHLLLRRARRPPQCARRAVRRRQRLAVELAVGRERKPVQRHKGRRHHVVRQALPEMRPQRRRIGSRRPRPPPHRPPAACCPAYPRARSPPPAPRRHGAPARPRSRPARCGSRAASPAHRPARGNPAPRPRASARGRRCGTCGSPPGRTDRPRTAPPSAPPAQDNRAPAPHPRCIARPQPPPAQAPDNRPEHKPACSRSDGRSGCADSSQINVQQRRL